MTANSNGFQLSDLARLRFAAVSEVPTPWMCLQQDLRDAGIAPATVTRVHDQTMTENYAALRGNTLDVMLAFEPLPRRLKSIKPAPSCMLPVRAGRPFIRPSSRPGAKLPPTATHISP